MRTAKGVFVRLVFLAFALAVMRTAPSQEPTTPQPQETPALAASSDIIAVVVLDRIEKAGLGPDFVFAIEKIVKLAPEKNVGRLDAQNFNELFRKSLALSDYGCLHLAYETYNKPAAESKELQELRQFLEKGKRFILYLPTARNISPVRDGATGHELPNTWGAIAAVPPGQVRDRFKTFAQETVDKIEESLKKEELLPSAEERTKIGRLIGKLGDKERDIREGALNELVAAGKAAIPQLREALAAADFEVRTRANAAICGICSAKPDMIIDGLNLTAKVNKSLLKKGDKLELTVEWENVGKEPLVVQRKRKSNPFMTLEIEGDLAYHMGAGEVDRTVLSSEPVVIESGKKLTIKKESANWGTSTYWPSGTTEWVKELQFGIDGFDDEWDMTGLKLGKYRITVLSRLANGKTVCSEPVEIELVDGE